MTLEEAYKLIFSDSERAQLSEGELQVASDAFISAILAQEDRLIM